MVYRNFDKISLEREYSPSSCIDDINVFIKQYIEQSSAATRLAISQKSLVADLSYGEQPRQLIDLYLPTVTNANNCKLQVYIHGGYWQELSKAESSFAATNFQSQGCHFAVINYSLAPEASLSDIVEQSRQAILWLHNNAQQFGYKNDEIYLSGSSAGAHLAMMALQTDWTRYDLPNSIVRGVCAVSGVYDLIPIVDTYVNDALKMDHDEAQKNSPLNDDLPQDTPIIMAFGENETSEFKRQTAAMADKIIQNGNELCCKQIAKRNHFDVILDLADANSWLCQQVFSQMNLKSLSDTSRRLR